MFASAATVDHFTRRTDFAPVVAVVAASTAPNACSVAFAASAGANANGSAWGDFEKPLYMLLEEEMEMWKEKGFQAPILRQVVDHDPTPMDAYEVSIEQARCDIVEKYSSAPSPRNLLPLQLKLNLPLLQVELDQMLTDERGQHGEELFVDKDTLSPFACAPSPWHSTLVPRHEPSTRALDLSHDVFNRIRPPNSVTKPSALAAVLFALGMPRPPERAYLALA